MSEVLLKVDGLAAWYGETQALARIDLEVRRGEVVCLLGRNGAGKTTTLRAIVGLLARGAVLAGGDYATVSKHPAVLEAYMGTEATELQGAH